MADLNQRILLRARPSAIPTPEAFTTDAVPIHPPGPDEVVLETLYLSVDPAMRSWMSDGGSSYHKPVPLGEVMRGGGIARVLESRSTAYKPGDLVQARLGWQSHPTIPARFLQPVDTTRGDALAWIGPLGLSAVTAYFGMREIGAVRPGEHVLVSAAAGGVGQIAAQIGQIEACRVTGIAGGRDKCDFLRNDLGLDSVIDYKAENDLAAAVGRACPDGIDVYFDNVGGPMLDAVLLNLRPGARVALCGRISQVSAAEPYGLRNTGQLGAKQARMQGFQVFSYNPRYEEARTWLAARLREGRLRQSLHILEGLHHAPAALGMLFRGENTGKLVVRVAS